MKFNFRIFWTSFIFFVILFSFMDLARAQWYYGTGEATNLENTIGFNLNAMKIITGETADPSAGGGYTAGRGSILLRDNGGSNGEAWLKTSGSATAWGQLVNKDTEGKLTGHGSAIVGKDQYRQYFNDGEADYSLASRWSTGDNASFMGGGALTGTFIISTTIINTIDQHSFKFTQGSLDEYVASKQLAIDIPITAGVAFDYQYDGADNDIEVELYCTSLSTSYSVGFLEAADGVTKPFSGSVYVPAGCGVARIGFSVAALNAGKILYFNRLIVSNNPFLYKDLLSTQYIKYDTHAGYGSTNTKIPYFTTATTNAGEQFLLIENTAANGFSVTALKKCTVNADYSVEAGANYITFSLNSTQLTTNADAITSSFRLGLTYAASGVGQTHSTSVTLNPGDILRPHSNAAIVSTAAKSHIVITAISESEHVVTPAKSGIEEVYYNGYTSVSTYAKYKTQQRSTLSKLASVDNTTYTKFTALKKVIASAYATGQAAGDRLITMKHFNSAATLLTSSISWGSYLNAPMSLLMNPGDYLVVELAGGGLSDVAATGFGATFVDFNQQVLSAIPTQKVCYLKDVKSSGTNGGTATAGSWTTRTLNVINETGSITTGSCSFATLSANKFTLQPGKYKINATVPALATNGHQALVYSVTGAANAIIGSSEYLVAANYVSTPSKINGFLEPSTPTEYDIRQRFETTRNNDGLGSRAGFTVDGEVYTQVEITKIK